MESAPPLNLTTTVKVEDLVITPENEPRDYTVEGELVEESAEDVQQKDDSFNEHIDVDEGLENQEIENNEKYQENPPTVEVLGSKNGLSTLQKEYQCNSCPSSFARASQLRAHERTHVEEQIYECDKCSSVFSRIGELMNHRREHQRQGFCCSECDATFTSYNAARIHMRRHKGDKPFNCPDCSMAFAQLCHLNIHRRVHTGEKPFICNVCQQKFKQASHLTTHLRIHTNDKPYKCNMCNAAFSQTSSLTRHKRRHSGEKPFKCEECGALFVERRNLSRHMLTHTGEKPYHCDKCGSRFAQMVDLKRHMMSHAGLKPYKCDVCEAAFSRQNNLRWHKLTHEGDTPFKCEKCNAGFSLKRDLKTHLRTHVGIKPYRCDICSATFSQLNTLKRHKLCHNVERQFICTQCNRAFKDKSALRRHMLRHEAVKPYACEKCNSTFIEFRNLKRHKVTVHGEERFEGADVELNEPVNNQNTIRPIKKRIEKLDSTPLRNQKMESVPIVELYEGSFQPATLQEQIEPSSQMLPTQTDPLDVSGSLQQVQPSQTEITTSVPSHPPQLPEILTIPSQTLGQMPALLLTQPGQPPKPARPANTCQNHQSHVLTFVEGNYNQWQSWCFCDTPNIPDSNPGIVDTTGVAVTQPPTTSAPPAPQNTYSEIQQRMQHQAVGVQEVSQTEYPVGQYSNNYNDSVHHFEDASQSDSAPSASQQQQQLGQQNNSKIDHMEERLFPISNIQHPEQGHHQLQQQTAPQQLVHHQHNQQQQFDHQRLQQQVQPTQSEQHHQSLQEHNPRDQEQEQQTPLSGSSRPQPELPSHPVGHNIQPGADPQVTYQYSLTVSNPATGDIQIQSEAFPANPSGQSSGAPIKKRRPVKNESKEISPNRLYKCDDCPKTFSRTNHLLIHQRVHTGEKPFQCGVCYQAFTHKNSLTIHMRGHTGERPYICPTCGTTFTQKSNLRVHLRTHTGEKPFKCDMCDLAFTQGSHLTAHKRIHNNERPFACDTCQQTFTQRSALKRHSFTHSGDKPHKCEHCTAKFSQRDDLRRHLRTHDVNNKKDGPSTSKGSNKKPKSEESESKVNVQKFIQEIKKQMCKYENCTSGFNDAHGLARHVRTVHDIKEEFSNDDIKKKKKKKKEEPVEILESSIKYTVSEPIGIEPTRTSKRIREAAKKKKQQKTNSDFIIGDFVDMLDEEESKPYLKSKSFKKETKIVVAKEKMESWCFCEVPHGPDEPHTHVSVETKVPVEQSNIHQAPSRQEMDNIIASADASGATSLLQLSMEHVHHEPPPTVISESFPPQSLPSGSVNLDSSSMVSTPHSMSTSTHSQGIQTASAQTDSTVIMNPCNNQIATVGHAQILNASQLVAQDGTIYIEAGSMLSNGAVVINPGQGTFISYEQLAISSDGQVIGVPVANSGTETLMIQPAGATVDTSTATGTVTYTAATQVSEPSIAPQPVQYTTLGGEVLSLFSQVEASKEAAAPTADKYTVIAKPLECSVCAKSFVQKRSLWTHMQTSHPDLFSCSECCAAFTTAEYLKHHKTQHQKLHVCSRCGMVFTTKSMLTRHRQQMHSSSSSVSEEKEKMYECTICRTKFYQQSDLKRHMLGHTGEKPVRCKHCDAGFTRTSSLNKHMRIHTGEKPYVCTECDQAFAYRYQFNRHKNVHKQQQPSQPQQQLQPAPPTPPQQEQEIPQQNNSQCTVCNYSMPYVFV